MEKVCTNGHVFNLEACDRCGAREPQTEIPVIKVKRTLKKKDTKNTKIKEMQKYINKESKKILKKAKETSFVKSKKK